MTERPLHCTIRNPITLNISDLKSEFHSGCRVIDVSLSNIINPEKTDLSLKSAKSKSKVADVIEEVKQNNPYAFTRPPNLIVGEIHFKNSYTAYLTVKAKCRVQDSKDGNEIKWRTCVKKMKLMPSPHVEAGAQDYFVVTRKHMQFELVNVSALRIILQQPSSVWKEFKIEDLKIYRSSESGRPNPLPAWLTDTPSKSGKKKIEPTEEDWLPPPVIKKDPDVMEDWDMGVANLEALSSTLQQLWALSEEVAAQQTDRALGRYEVDGCYEINLLSYT